MDYQLLNMNRLRSFLWSQLLIAIALTFTSCSDDAFDCARASDENTCRAEGCTWIGAYKAQFTESGRCIIDDTAGPNPICVSPSSQHSNADTMYYRDDEPKTEIYAFTADIGRIDGWTRCNDGSPLGAQCGCSYEIIDGYRPLAEEVCSGDPNEVVLSSTLYSLFDAPLGIRLLTEYGEGFYYLAGDCTLYTGQSCFYTSSEDCSADWYYRSSPFTQTRMSIEEVTVLLRKLRVLERSQIPNGGYFPVDHHEPYLMVRFQEHHFLASPAYLSDDPWGGQQPDENLNRPVDYLIRDAVGGLNASMVLTGILADAITRRTEVVGDSVRVASLEIDLDAISSQQVRERWLESPTLDWPLSEPPSSFIVADEYCHGQTTGVYHEDAEAMRELLSSAREFGPPQHGEYAVQVLHDNTRYAIWIRESLPIEGDDGLIPGTIQELGLGCLE